MSMRAALKAERAVALAAHVLAIELVCACQAIDLLAPLDLVGAADAGPRAGARGGAAARRRSSAGAGHRGGARAHRRRRCRVRVRRGCQLILRSTHVEIRIDIVVATCLVSTLRFAPPATRAHDHRRPLDSRAPRRDAQLQGLAAGSGAAHADEQPRSGGGRAARGSRRLRRHRPRGAQLGGLRRDRRRRCARSSTTRRCWCSRASRSASSAPTRRAARAHRQRQPRAGLGDLGDVSRSRGSRPDDVRPDDRRQLDLHRHAGHPAGHLRNPGGAGGAPFRRHARRPRSPSPPASAAWAAPSRWP